MLRFVVFSLNLVVPGSGLAALGQIRWALVTQAGLILAVTLLCWSRLVFEPIGIQVSLALITIIYFASSVFCLVIDRHGDRSYLLHTLGFIVVSLTVFSSGFLFKDRLLGVHVFFVPSMSMYPTLKPGQFILIDTWAYTHQQPMEADIVVFSLKESSQWAVKRISTWPDGKLQQDGLWYMLGDNSAQSSDSRYFGGIDTNSIAGKVMLILYELKNNKSREGRNYLKKIPESALEKK